jgi:single-stranded DNA-binding protein
VRPASGQKQEHTVSIEAAVLGTAVKDAEPRTSTAGKPWLSVVRRSDGGDAAQFVQVAVFGDAAVALGRIEKGARPYAEGSIRINEWTAPDGAKRHGLAMAAWRAERPGIGKNPPRRDQAPLQPAQRPLEQGHRPHQGYSQQQQRPGLEQREFFDGEIPPW